MNNNRFPQYTTEYISGVMSLRSPQKKSLEILDDIMNSVTVRKGMNLKAALGAINAMYPICSDFEREFMSLTFALATGVGKTRLMGAFITYLYTQHNIKNFMIVAPNTTIYEKLKRDVSDISSPKYVFNGLGCFAIAPQIIVGDDYKEKTISLFDPNIKIYVYNIDKFNKDEANMKKVNEHIGDSFYQYLSSLDDLVILMDESHHYRADKGMQAINELKPLLGLELTATPLVASGSKQIPFKNVVYEYPLSKAIKDGYTRTPYALTRSDIDFYNFGEEQIDKMMLIDGIRCHENTKSQLETFALSNGKKPVKPFMLIVCKDTEHATWVESFVKSDEFRDGKYRNKTIVVHSKQRGAESEANMRLLLGVEDSYNPIEIVIHVNMLKEGWDVNNLYTIVPLRTAASSILREQMVGRGLRLPYGERTGNDVVDRVVLTAHDKIQSLIEEAQSDSSIFKAGNIIQAEDLHEEQVIYTQMTLPVMNREVLDSAYSNTGITQTEENDAIIRRSNELIHSEIQRVIRSSQTHTVSHEDVNQIVQTVGEQIANDVDLGTTYQDNSEPFAAWLRQRTEEVHRETVEKYIPIPKIKITDEGVEEVKFVEFDMDLTEFTHVPIQNELYLQNLQDISDIEKIKGDALDFDAINPKKEILFFLRQKPEINYDVYKVLLNKLISQVVDHFESKYGNNGMRNIVMMYKRDLANRIYNQMMQEDHFYSTNGFLQEEVIGVTSYNIPSAYSFAERVGLYASYTLGIRSVLFEGISKGVFDSAKFDSVPELTFAKVIERDDVVENWLRPAPNQFNITYNHGHLYEPDFVVETKDCIYLVEVKGEDKINTPEVLAKKDRAIKYCEVATRWGKANNYKKWQYLFIPSQRILPNSSFSQLAQAYIAL